MKTLEQIDKQIRTFVWSGQEDSQQSRVDYKTILLPKEEGGLGLISVKFQFFALVGGFILWTAEEGDHTLQHVLRSKVGDLSEVQGGVRDFSWLVSNHGTKPKGESQVWTGFCAAWNTMKKEIVPKKPANWYEKSLIPLWTTHLIHRERQNNGTKNRMQKTLRDCGILTLGDVTHPSGGLHSWTTLPNPRPTSFSPGSL